MAPSKLETYVSAQGLGRWAQNASLTLHEESRTTVRGDVVNFLRRKANILRKSQEQRNPFFTYETLWGKDEEVPKYIRGILEKSIIDLSAHELTDLVPSQREVLALYALTIHPDENHKQSHKPHIQLHKFVNRLHNAHKYQTHEDWLESASMVVEIDGTSIQDLLKDQAKIRIDSYLASQCMAHGKRTTPTVYDFAIMSDVIVDTVYVHNRAKPLFLNHPTFYDFDKLIAPKIDKAPQFIRDHYPFSTQDTRKREQTMEDFFAYQYPELFWSGRNIPELMAETYAIYMTIHPMTDGNGTMIHSLLDHALLARKLNPIPAWNKGKLSKPLAELRQWIQGNVYPLEQWFDNQIRQANSIF